MHQVQPHRAKFLTYRVLHNQLKGLLSNLGFEVREDGQIFKFTDILVPEPRRSKPKARAKKRRKGKKAATGKAKTASSNAVAEGRRAVARGDRPPMKIAIAKVMGDKVMDAAQVIEGLTAKGWLPNTPPEKTQQYISYILSSTDDAFQRVERGKYKAIPQRKARKPEGWETTLMDVLSKEKFVGGFSLARKLGWTTTQTNQRLARLKVVGKVEDRMRSRHREWKISSQATA